MPQTLSPHAVAAHWSPPLAWRPTTPRTPGEPPVRTRDPTVPASAATSRGGRPSRLRPRRRRLRQQWWSAWKRPDPADAGSRPHHRPGAADRAPLAGRRARRWGRGQPLGRRPRPRAARDRRVGAVGGLRALPRGAGPRGRRAALRRFHPPDPAGPELPPAVADRGGRDARRHPRQPHRDRLPLWRDRQRRRADRSRDLAGSRPRRRRRKV